MDTKTITQMVTAGILLVLTALVGTSVLTAEQAADIREGIEVAACPEPEPCAVCEPCPEPEPVADTDA